MNFRGLSYFFVAFFCLVAANESIAQPTIWDSSPVGQCVEKFSEDIKTNGPETKVKEESRRGSSGERYVWIWDSAPEKSPARELFRVSKEDKGCVILFLPFSETNDFKIDKKRRLPEKVVSFTDVIHRADGNPESVETEYSLNKATGSYSKYPVVCRRRIADVARKIDCANAFE